MLCVVQGTDGACWCQTIHAVLNVYLDEAAINQRPGKDRTPAAIGRFPQQGVPHRAVCERAGYQLCLSVCQSASEDATSGLVRCAGEWLAIRINHRLNPCPVQPGWSVGKPRTTEGIVQ